MNFSLFFGLITALAILFASLKTAINNPEILLNSHAFLLVVGGVVGAAVIAYPWSIILKLAKEIFIMFRYRILDTKKTTNSIVSKMLNESVDEKIYSNGQKELNNFVKSAIDLAASEYISQEEVIHILRKKFQFERKDKEQFVVILRTLSKAAPAFGLLGTTLGMIGLLQNLGSPDSFKLLGPTMAVGLVATLYGLLISNLILIPLSENLQKRIKQEETIKEIIIEGARLIKQQVHNSIIKEILLSYADVEVGD